MMARMSSLVITASSCRGGDGVQIPPDGSLAGVKGVGDFRHRQPLISKFPGPAWLCLGGACLTPTVDAPLLGDLDARRLTLSPELQLDLGQPQHNGGDHPTDRPAQVDLLRHYDHPQPTLAPVSQDVDTISQAAAQAVELPDHDRLHGAVEDG